MISSFFICCWQEYTVRVDRVECILKTPQYRKGDGSFLKDRKQISRIEVRRLNIKLCKYSTLKVCKYSTLEIKIFQKKASKTYHRHIFFDKSMSYDAVVINSHVILMMFRLRQMFHVNNNFLVSNRTKRHFSTALGFQRNSSDLSAS
jgi:hypothetical protein